MRLYFMTVQFSWEAFSLHIHVSIDTHTNSMCRVSTCTCTCTLPPSVSLDLYLPPSYPSQARPKIHRHYTITNSLFNLPREIRSNLTLLLPPPLPTNNLTSHLPLKSDNQTSDHPAPHAINSMTLSHLFHTGGPSWKPGSFCKDFLERRYHTSVKVCKKTAERDTQISCFWNPLNAHAATCDIDDVMVRPQKLWNAMKDVQHSFPHSGAISLLNNDRTTCEQPTISKYVCK